MLIVGTGFKTFPLLLDEFTRIYGNIAAAFSAISITIAWLVSIHIILKRSKAQGISPKALRVH